MLVTIEKVLLLKQIPVFKTVSNMALSDLMAVSEEKTIKKGERLIVKDQQNRYVYFLLSGSLEESEKNNKKNITAHAVVGLESVFLMAQAGKDVVAQQESIVLVVERGKLYRMMALHPSLAGVILNELSLMIRK
ncbi:MAG: cyclic nucleotide-binding domain-containing protein [Alphaproteobacteria bacterium]|nr:cyclic nucleotide-binding domain-containing protein [Alphaproteobacteria bacterium]